MIPPLNILVAARRWLSRATGSLLLALAALLHPAILAAQSPAILSPPGTDIDLVALPNGDLLHIDRTTGRAIQVNSTAFDRAREQALILSVDNAGIAGFARYGEAGRLFELARPLDDHPRADPRPGIIVGWTEYGEITYILGQGGEVLIPHRDASGALTSITTQFGYVTTGTADTPARAWTYPGLSLELAGIRSPTLRRPPELQRPDPVRFMSLSTTDRFLRQAQDLIHRNLEGMPAREAIGDWEDYWTSGRYLTEDPYYVETIGALGEAKGLDYWASGEPAREYFVYQAELTAILYAQFGISAARFLPAGKLLTGATNATRLRAVREFAAGLAFEEARLTAREGVNLLTVSALPPSIREGGLQQGIDAMEAGIGVIKNIYDYAKAVRPLFRTTRKTRLTKVPGSGLHVRQQDKALYTEANKYSAVIQIGGPSHGQIVVKVQPSPQLKQGPYKAWSSSAGSNILAPKTLAINGTRIDLADYGPLPDRYVWQRGESVSIADQWPLFETFVKKQAKKAFRKAKSKAFDDAAAASSARMTPKEAMRDLVAEMKADWIRTRPRKATDLGGVLVAPRIAQHETTKAAGIRALVSGCNFAEGASCDLAD